MVWATPGFLLDTDVIEILPKSFANHNLLLWSFKNQKKANIWRLDNFYDKTRTLNKKLKKI